MGRLRKPKLLIVGCGDVGLRLAALAAPRWRVLALSSSPERLPLLRSQGIVPISGDLDQPATLARLAGLSRHIVMLAPPPPQGDTDPRSRHLLACLRRSSMIGGASQAALRLVYASTSGVYGDCGGDRIDETRAPRPANARARRRLDAERCWRRGGRRSGVISALVRIPGIYDAAARSPRARLRAGTPALRDEDDVHTNHIHADDLARILWLALFRGAPGRVYHAVDDSDIKAGDYLDLAARLYRLAPPLRVSLQQARDGALTPQSLSFLTESRRLDNRRLKCELGVRLRFPTVAEGLLGGT